MPTNPVHGTAAAGGVAGASVALIVWLLSLAQITVPSDVAIAIGVLLTAAAGVVIHGTGGSKPEPATKSTGFRVTPTLAAAPVIAVPAAPTA